MNGRHGPFWTIAVLIGRLLLQDILFIYTPFDGHVINGVIVLHHATRRLLANGRLVYILQD